MNRTFLVVQWQMNETRVLSLIVEEPTCFRAAKPVHRDH